MNFISRPGACSLLGVAYDADSAVEPLIIMDALGIDDYPRVAEKVRLQNVPDYWCDATECGCKGCANRFLTWAEYECWHKYGPEFNKVCHPESLIPTPRQGGTSKA